MLTQQKQTYTATLLQLTVPTKLKTPQPIPTKHTNQQIYKQQIIKQLQNHSKITQPATTQTQAKANIKTQSN